MRQRLDSSAQFGGRVVSESQKQSTALGRLHAEISERAALLWTEKLTLIAVDHAPDAVYEQARSQFSEEELANLTLLVVTINAWNRFGISFRSAPGRYKPKKREQ